jgi:hypothetical protein
LDGHDADLLAIGSGQANLGRGDLTVEPVLALLALAAVTK